DNPNLRWGSPSFVLEPGDPGYVPVSAAPGNPKTKIKKMKHQRFYPTRAADQVVWLENFRNKLGNHTAALGLDAAVVALCIAAARWLVYVLGSWLPAVRAYSLSCTAASKEAQTGDGTSLMALPVFTPPPLPAADGAIPAVEPQNTGALTLIFEEIQRIKESPGYTDAIGADLGIIGPEDAAPDFTTLQPVLALTVAGNAVQIDWGWQGYTDFLDQCEIEVDRGTGGGWTLLTFDTTPGYTDTAAHPATPAKWKYRAIYRVDDHQVGQWSAEVSVMVGG
ncbi:MAG: hypothetical protein KDM64_13795, partial [Verrucomicrobiae bacterium]|nr:hypothetical protein [Verrucomicrobiae bacterium]